MFPDLQKLTSLVERATIALERIADAQEFRTEIEATGATEKLGEKANRSIRLRDVAKNGVEAEMEEIG